jgi:phosphatidate cytidylyltransferase
MENEPQNNHKNRVGLEVNQISEKTQKNMFTRIISGIILACICFPLAFLGGYFYFGLITIVALIAIYEMIISINTKGFPIPLFIFIYVCAVCLIYWGFLKNNLLYYNSNNYVFPKDPLSIGFSSLFLSPIDICICLGVMFLITLFSEKFTIEHISYYFMMTVLLALGFQSLFFLRYITMNELEFSGAPAFDTPVYKYCISAFLLLYMLIGSAGNDIGAYFAGVLFGKHKLNERISPHKTWEGFFGGIILAAILSISFSLICDACGHPILPGYLDNAHWYYVLVSSLIMPLVSVLGDLAFSAIKRHFGVKDFGFIIPGHGGVLDRIDSIVFCSIGLTCFLILVINGWDFTL